MMGGAIHVESEPGRGSRFWFDLDLPVGTAGPAQAADAVTLPGKRILVVDDRALNRQIIAQHLQTLECQVVECDSATQALGILAQERARGGAFDAAIVDAEMPTMDGFMLVRAVRAQPEFRQLPILMLSSSHERRFHPGEEGLIDTFLLKPVRRGVLVETLVRSLGRAARRQSPAPPAAPANLACRVLVAEDNAINQLVVRQMLDKLGCDVTMVSDGQSVIDAAAQGGYAFILMDCQMPKIDGYDAARAIRAQEAASGSPRVPIIAVTANAMAGTRDACLAAGMDDYVSKPISAAALSEVLARWATPALNGGR
jgi:CheY-like chemotaxis protein